MGECRGCMSPTALLEDRSIVPGHRNQSVGMRGLALEAVALGLKSVHCYGDNGKGLKRATLAVTDPQSLVLLPSTEQVRQDSPSAWKRRLGGWASRAMLLRFEDLSIKFQKVILGIDIRVAGNLFC